LKQWPVPQSLSRNLPSPPSSGSFWEDRGDRHHCGVDIYAPRGSGVVSVMDGKVMDTGMFTSPDEMHYWNITFYVVVRNRDGMYCRYAEMGTLAVDTEERVRKGDRLGQVGQVLEKTKITGGDPTYIQKLKEASTECMLHLEVYSDPMVPKPGSGDYRGGNWFGKERPANLVDAGVYLLEE